MERYAEKSTEELRLIYGSLLSEFEKYKSLGLSLDLSRGKPNSSQLDISEGLLSVDVSGKGAYSAAGLDCRNYGVVDGLPEAKRFFGEVYGIPEEKIIVGGNSSLQLMYDTLARAMLFGVPGSVRPWCRESGLKWICVVPGYDRHFRVTESLGFELVSVNMTPDGPDMDAVEELVRDPSVKGIWCVPKYSNPTGNTYSDEVVRRLASMRCAAPDFRIMWDNAYAVHSLEGEGDRLLDIFAEAERCGNGDRVLYFASTSKVTFPGGGVAIMAMSEENRRWALKHIGTQTIGFDKLNQLRHLKFFGTAENLMAHMSRLGSAIKAKFDIVAECLSVLSGLGIAEWTNPRGGYFVSLDVMPGTARRVFALMREAGVTLTAVGATYPYGIDPEDKNLRLAPTYPTNEELRTATEILTVAVRMAAIEKLLA
ncbi:MAG: aminotransferase [Clostridia bacterium]|nr:aminotransferase [Clostridia bacterium]